MTDPQKIEILVNLINHIQIVDGQTSAYDRSLIVL